MPYRVWFSVMLLAAALLGAAVQFVDLQAGTDGRYDRYAHPEGAGAAERESESAYRRLHRSANPASKLVSLTTRAP